jgi:hypothetical protein
MKGVTFIVYPEMQKVKAAADHHLHVSSGFNQLPLLYSDTSSLFNP